jgi:hypothetical protein
VSVGISPVATSTRTIWVKDFAANASRTFE